MSDNVNAMAEKKSALGDVVKIIYIDGDNAEFTERNGLIALKYRLPENAQGTDLSAEPAAQGTDLSAASAAHGTDLSAASAAQGTDLPAAPENPGVKEYDRVFLHRCFPNEYPEEYLSVLDRDNKEIGIIRKLSDFPDATAELLRRELGRKYHVFAINAIISVKDRYGYSYWKVKDDNKEREFTVRDTYRSITKVSEDKLFISDVDGNRYEIRSLAALDRASYKKIELFL